MLLLTNHTLRTLPSKAKLNGIPVHPKQWERQRANHLLERSDIGSVIWGREVLELSPLGDSGIYTYMHAHIYLIITFSG